MEPVPIHPYDPMMPLHWEHFDHDADIGIRGIAPTLAQSFEQAAMALTAVIVDPDRVIASESLSIHCQASDHELLLLDWINELIFLMAARGLLFSRFRVSIDDLELRADAMGEAVDITRHHPAVEVKGATFTELRVYQTPDGMWVAQCVVDV
ncbi:MAG: archease [Gammaproteobacteria bacterium]